MTRTEQGTMPTDRLFTGSDLPPFCVPLIMQREALVVLPPFLIQVLRNSGGRSRLFDELSGCPVL
jgi:hypothetical protein